MKARNRSLLIFLVTVVGVGWLIGATNLPGAWYAALEKPSFNPPNWVFAPAWTILYVMIAISGWSTYSQETNGLASQVWLGQMALNFLWSPIVFRLHNLAMGLSVIVLLLGLILLFIVLQWQANRLAARLFIPYAAWVAFASLLNFSLYRLN
ncbi:MULTISPECIES: TspO/MBR family protein [unclassified Bradyrhizobium]|uniref:TspO/MBR family protein n=1 Tax=unclassified Bradyrhizobium TaxID=2631580 RepID=UPI001BAD98E3|nr:MULTISPECIES: TspO/MBR family protein [unclassified Bradyrhizobium]MBR1206086.1 tryptophan-rich sensory protein [Bradyrhizobium sp. AUGA SZCCT0124]MBR1314788.1 tryptophan-rich sensory protein [Bradyrhizobium sp. AUGA SZCCT0051]MBR1341759.1 tryptophan-rich sensory protein [Bradyrhizobium sp. AUGA SZCCT0105]MBR1358840.1 tryptophan-rich sensory protein [Bradyrhizobium sp. AUGA SZCCT0045]